MPNITKNLNFFEGGHFRANRKNIFPSPWRESEKNYFYSWKIVTLRDMLIRGCHAECEKSFNR
jgi:hypothetical protein